MWSSGSWSAAHSTVRNSNEELGTIPETFDAIPIWKWRTRVSSSRVIITRNGNWPTEAVAEAAEEVEEEGEGEGEEEKKKPGRSSQYLSNAVSHECNNLDTRQTRFRNIWRTLNGKKFDGVDTHKQPAQRGERSSSMAPPSCGDKCEARALHNQFAR